MNIFVSRPKTPLDLFMESFAIFYVKETDSHQVSFRLDLSGEDSDDPDSTEHLMSLEGFFKLIKVIPEPYGSQIRDAVSQIDWEDFKESSKRMATEADYQRRKDIEEAKAFLERCPGFMEDFRKEILENHVELLAQDVSDYYSIVDDEERNFEIACVLLRMIFNLPLE